jgi:hypothetical protein
MPKLPKEYKFIDLSDYGRPIAILIANRLKNTTYTPIHVTIAFIVAGLIAISCIIYNYMWFAALFLIIKSILDAADGELARLKNTPSYVGRYLDSIADITLNFLIFITLCYVTEANLIITLLAFLGIQLQGTLYNYYYVILRNNLNGDTTSRVFENSIPVALQGEKQKNVTLFYKIYKALYGSFDKAIYNLDYKASKDKNLPPWFMTLVSTFGLGFQLLIIAILLVFGVKEFIIPFFLSFSILIIIFILIRKNINK